MSELRKNVLAVLFSFGILIVTALILSTINDHAITSSDDLIFRSTFGKVKVGMSEEEVITFLGHPDSRSSEFHLGQRIGFEEAYLRAEVSDAKEFLFWNREIDLVYVIGVNRTGRIVLLEKGGT